MRVELPDRAFWCTLGGGIEGRESVEAAVRRELYEETGLTDAEVRWGPPIWHGEHVLERGGVATLLQEIFVVAYAQQVQPTTAGLTQEEKEVTKEFRWWSLEAMQASKELIVPPSMKRHLEPILRGDMPEKPIEIDLRDQLAVPGNQQETGSR